MAHSRTFHHGSGLQDGEASVVTRRCRGGVPGGTSSHLCSRALTGDSRSPYELTDNTRFVGGTQLQSRQKGHKSHKHQRRALWRESYHTTRTPLMPLAEASPQR